MLRSNWRLTIGPSSSGAASPRPSHHLPIPTFVDRAAPSGVVPGQPGGAAVLGASSGVAEGAHHRSSAGGAASAIAHRHNHAWIVSPPKQGKRFSASPYPTHQQDGDAEHGAEAEREPPAQVRGEEVLVEQSHRQDRATCAAQPERPVNDRIDPTADPGGDQLVDGGVDGGVLTADSGAGEKAQAKKYIGFIENAVATVATR